MKNVSREIVEALLVEQEWPAATIYLPISRSGDDRNPLQYKQQLEEVKTQLIEGGWSSAKAKSLLQEELELVKDPEFWRNTGADTLVLFLSTREKKRYLLPMQCRELVQVGTRFHLKPLVPLLADSRYLLLALNKGGVSLYQGDRFGLVERDLPSGMPKDLAEALPYDDPERQLQYHVSSGTPGAKQGAIYHGHGAGIDEEESNLERFYQAVDRYLFPALDEEQCPVILGGVDEQQAIYRRLTKGKSILPEGVRKNINELSTKEMHLETWPIAAEYFRQAPLAARREYRQYHGTGRASDDLNTILIEAYQGRVGTLLATEDLEVWGVFNTSTLEPMVIDRNEAPSLDLIDEAVFWTLKRDGVVHLMKAAELPSETGVAALFRY